MKKLLLLIIAPLLLTGCGEPKLEVGDQGWVKACGEPRLYTITLIRTGSYFMEHPERDPYSIDMNCETDFYSIDEIFPTKQALIDSL